jgi:hypothetical protein
LYKRLTALKAQTTSLSRMEKGTLRKVDTAAEEQAKRTNLLSASAKLGYKDFDYLDTVSLADKSAGKKVYGGRISWAKYIWADAAIAFDFEYQDTFKAAAEKSFVLPPDANGLQELKTGAYGAPSRSVKRLYSFEFRKRVTSLPGNNGGIAIKITYNQVDDVIGVRIPIYCIKDDSSNNSGGIELGWTDHKDKKKAKFTVGLVIGSGLKLQP